MSKHLKIVLVENGFHYDYLVLNEDEYPYVYLKKEVTDEDLERALDILATGFMQRKLNHMDVNLDLRNNLLAPAEEMTLEEIEAKLGHKIKIVKEK